MRVKADRSWTECDLSETERFHVALLCDTSSTYRLSRRAFINYGCAFGTNASVCVCVCVHVNMQRMLEANFYSIITLCCFLICKYFKVLYRRGVNLK